MMSSAKEKYYKETVTELKRDYMMNAVGDVGVLARQRLETWDRELGRPGPCVIPCVMTSGISDK